MKRPLLFIGNLILILLIFPILLTAQYPPDAIWMNAKNGVPWDTIGPPQLREIVNSNYHRFGPNGIEYDSLISTLKSIQSGVSTYNDKDGEILLFSNGFRIANRYGENIAGGGDNLYNIDKKNVIEWGLVIQHRGINDPQSHIILPDPEDSLLFHLFHVRLHLKKEVNIIDSIKLYHTVISMHDQERKGLIVQLPICINSDLDEVANISAHRHADGKQWWIITRSYTTNSFLIYLLDQGGIHFSHKSSNFHCYYDPQSRALFSPDGKYLAIITHSIRANPLDKLEVCLYRFYDNSGELYFEKSITTDWEEYVSPGLAFSPNSKYLYFTTFLHMYQIDIEVDNPEIKLIDVVEAYQPKSLSGFQPMFDGKLSPDCRILTVGDRSWMHSIEQPDEAGYASIPNQRVLYNKRLYVHHLPNSPHYRLGTDMQSWCDTYGYKDPGNPRHGGESEIVRPHYKLEEIETMHNGLSDEWYHEYIGNRRIQNQLIELKKE